MDKNLTCKDCGKSFPFSKSEQDFFASKNFSEPVRCKECRQIVKQRKMEQGGYQDNRGGYQDRRGGNDRRNRY